MSHALILFALSLTAADTGPTPLANAEPWKMTLGEAIQIGMENADAVRIIPSYPPRPAGELVIFPLADWKTTSLYRFKAEVMAQLRSIEQVYWTLGQRLEQLDACEKAVRLGEEILKREMDELEVCCPVADLAEIQQRLEQFRLDFVRKTSDVITAERQLRHLLGLPEKADRRIVPVTDPTLAKQEPDWYACRAAMLEMQPDIARQKGVAELTEKKAAEAESNAVLASRLGVADLAPSPADLKRVRDAAVRERTLFAQVVAQTTHSLARFFLEIDANYKALQTASKFREAAANRLEAQRAFYEEGRITIDRYLDAVAQYKTAVEQVAQFKAAYNISLIALEEARGTLLDHEKITVADVPRPMEVATASTPKPAPTRDSGIKAASFEVAPGNVVLDPAQADGAGKTVSFHFAVGSGPRPIDVRGWFTVAPAKAVAR